MTTPVNTQEKAMSRKPSFWYDVKAVAAGHVEITANVAGLSLAVLLVLPVFSGNVVSFLENRWVVNALFFFFTSFLLGIISSFQYSVLSGDNRQEKDLVVGFIGPSVSFGLSVPLLFLGFLYVLESYFSHTPDIYICGMVRAFVILVLWGGAVLVSRTIVEALNFVSDKQDWASRWYKEKVVLKWASIYALATILPWLRLIGVFPIAPPDDMMSNVYFGSAIVVALLDVLYYVIFSYVGLEPSNPNQEEGNIGAGVSGFQGVTISTRMVIKMTKILHFVFAVFVVATLLIFA